LGGENGYLKEISDKVVDCEDDPETGTRRCRAMIKNKNTRFATGSNWELSLDKAATRNLINKLSIFEEDEGLVEKSRRRAEADCRGDSHQ